MTPGQQQPAEPMRIGAIAYDTRRRAVGRVMEVGPYRAALRPLGGGTEWLAPHAHVRPATSDETAEARADAPGRAP